MAIVVKHGLGIPGLVGDYEAGRKKAMTEGARIAERDRRPDLVAPAIHAPRGSVQQSQAQAQPRDFLHRPIAPTRPQQPRLMSMPRRRENTMPGGINTVSLALEQDYGKELNTVVDTNNRRWADYRQKMIDGGFGDPGPSAGAATGVYGGMMGGGGGGRSTSSAITDKQASAFNALSEAYQDAVDSGDYTPEELEKIRRQIDARKMGINPIEKMKPTSPYPAGRGIGETWSEGGNVISRKPDGTPFPLGQTKQTISPETYVKMYDSVASSMSVEGKAVDPVEVERRVTEMLNSFQRFSGEGGQSAPGTAPGAGAPSKVEEFQMRNSGNSAPSPASPAAPVDKVQLREQVNALMALPQEERDAKLAESSKRTGVPANLILKRMRETLGEK